MNPPPPILPAPPPDAGGLVLLVLGAAVLLAVVIGWVLLAWQRNRHQFEIMKAGLERGVTHFPGALPLWLVSLRRGILNLALGVSLIIIGAAAWALAAYTPMPANAGPFGPHAMLGPGRPGGVDAHAGGPTSRPGMETSEEMRRQPPPPGAPPEGADDDRGGPPPQPFMGRDDRPGPGAGPGPGRRGPGQFGGREANGQRPGHQPPYPEMDRWLHAQAQEAVGKIGVACGIILTLLGLVRIGFARVERRYLNTSNPPGA